MFCVVLSLCSVKIQNSCGCATVGVGCIVSNICSYYCVNDSVCISSPGFARNLPKTYISNEWSNSRSKGKVTEVNHKYNLRGVVAGIEK